MQHKWKEEPILNDSPPDLSLVIMAIIMHKNHVFLKASRHYEVVNEIKECIIAMLFHNEPNGIRTVLKKSG